MSKPITSFHLFHQWSRWETYTWHGTLTYMPRLTGAQVVGPYQIEETRQKRTCTTCGMTQEREVKS